ncbi:phage tail tube protein [Agrobacterium tumefaciens]|uniref:phage tail tube protein n=1 Tax=Agrobacterium tumefaciens TaxID=358 RepID=UPI003B9F9D10
MAKPVTEDFHQMVLEVETETPGTWAKICGITGRTISRTTNMSETEVPADCDDESLPNDVEITPQSQAVTIAGTAVWARQSHEMMMDWWYLAQRKNIRVAHLNAAVGDTEYETGFAYLTNMNDDAQKGQGKVTREIEIRFDGIPTRTAKAA